MDHVVTALASTFFDWIFLILSSNKATHKRLDEFEILQDPRRTYELATLEHLENPHRVIMGKTL